MPSGLILPSSIQSKFNQVPAQPLFKKILEQSVHANGLHIICFITLPRRGGEVHTFYCRGLLVFCGCEMSLGIRLFGVSTVPERY